MIIKEVTVTCHEKRNHPYEYGHRDSGVTLVAEINSDLPNSEIVDLQAMARKWVDRELDGWIEEIEHKRYLDGVRQDILNRLYFLQTTDNPCSKTKEILRRMEKLPIIECDEIKRKIRLALEKNKQNQEFYKQRGELPF